MKIRRLVNTVILASTGILATSCGPIQKLCDKKNKNKMEVTEDERKIVEYMRANEVTYADVEGIPNPFWEGNCPTTCCEEVIYCGVNREAIKKYIKNYRDNDWVQNSPYFDTKSGENLDSIMEVITMGSTDPDFVDPYPNANNFDSRFMDIPIDELYNYLCVIKSNDHTSNANICRFYYMRYDDHVRDEYKNKQSLAIVPVYVNTSSGVVNTEYSEPFTIKNREGDTTEINPVYAVGVNNCELSPWKNHNHLCPPFKNCLNNTILEEIDLNGL